MRVNFTSKSSNLKVLGNAMARSDRTFKSIPYLSGSRKETTVTATPTIY